VTAHLLLVTLGPVQDFIAQARRTRDLWYGSHLLSELGRAAARALVDDGAKLIFPSLQKGDPQLDQCFAPLRADGTPPQNIANKILAEVPDGVEPQQLASAARRAVMDFWRDEIAARVKESCHGILADDIDAVWAEQIDTFLEFAASWLPLGDYASTRCQLEQAIAGRKLLRDFGSWKQGRGNVPKSSLDGARETVLLPPRSRRTALVRKYRIADGEQLDAVGLVKRAGGKPEQFVPVVNVALASWLERASQVASKELDGLKRACSDAEVSSVTREDLPCVTPFAFDASVLLSCRWRSVFEEQGRAEREADAEAWGRQHVKPLFGKLLEPYPYVACLLADGDHMGRAINSICLGAEDPADVHCRFSKSLASFADAARKTVEQQHRGALVYAGGDDVLAFVSLPEALACANDLRMAFESAMARACGSLVGDQRPTLSVGIGIGHVMESMGDLLTLGRQAEREAKRDRNALAVLVDKRSGGTRSWRAQWSTEPVQTLNDAAALLRDRLPSRKIYEISGIHLRLPKPDDARGDGWTRVLALEAKRTLSRVEGGSLRPEDVGLDLDIDAGYASLHRRVDDWVNRLLIARTFDRAAARERRSQEPAA
jgi:CRISPR-associated protein Cmr2